MRRTDIRWIVALALAGALWGTPAPGQNLLTNGSFDRDLSSWRLRDPGTRDVTAVWLAGDADGSQQSGSAHIAQLLQHHPGGTSDGSILSQLFPAKAGQLYEVGAKVRVPSGQTAPGTARLLMSWQLVPGTFDPDDIYEGWRREELPTVAAVDQWVPVKARFRAPDDIAGDSLELYLGLLKGFGAGEFAVQFDDVYVRAVGMEDAHVYLVPGISHARGVGDAFWVSDLTVFNPGEQTAQLTLGFTGKTALSPVTRSLGPRQQLSLEDVLVAAFGLVGEDTGAIRVTSDVPLDVRARTYSRGVDPKTGEVTTYGQSYPGVEPALALAGTQLGYLAGLRSDGGFRSNLELVNAGDGNATVNVRFFDARGAVIGGELTRSAEPGERIGVTAALPAGHRSGYAEISLWPPESRVITFGSVIDGTTNDPTTIHLTPGPARSFGLDGTWEGTASLVEVTTESTRPADLCLADDLRAGLASGSPAQLTISGDTLNPDAMPAALGTCQFGGRSPGSVWILDCDFGLPRKVTCADGTTTFHGPLDQNTTVFVIDGPRADGSIGFDYNVEPNYFNRLNIRLHFDLYRKH